MKDYGSDKKALSFDQYDAQSPKMTHSSPNADIQYLLSYITLDPSQQLNLTHQSLKQQPNPQALSTQTLLNYITLNSNPETYSPPQRQTLISIIDSGIHLISGIKKVMHKRKLEQQKNKSTMSSLEIFKELFFGKQLRLETTEYGGQEFGKRKQTDVLMGQLRIKLETDMLLAKAGGNDQTDGNSALMGKREFLLTKSLKERLEQGVKEGTSKLLTVSKITELDKMLGDFQEYREKNISIYGQLQEQRKRLNGIWTLIEEISAQL